MCRKLKELERKVRGEEEKEDMIGDTEIDTEINKRGFVSDVPESFCIMCFICVLHSSQITFVIRKELKAVSLKQTLHSIFIVAKNKIAMDLACSIFFL